MSAGSPWGTVNLETRLRYWLDEYEYSVLRADYWRGRMSEYGIGVRTRVVATLSWNDFTARQGFAFSEIMYIWDLMGMTCTKPPT